MSKTSIVLGQIKSPTVPSYDRKTLRLGVALSRLRYYTATLCWSTTIWAANLHRVIGGVDTAVDRAASVVLSNQLTRNVNAMAIRCPLFPDFNAMPRSQEASMRSRKHFYPVAVLIVGHRSAWSAQQTAPGAAVSTSTVHGICSATRAQPVQNGVASWSQRMILIYILILRGSRKSHVGRSFIPSVHVRIP